MIYILFLSMFFISFVSAIVGVRPAYYEIDFEPNLRKDFVFYYAFNDGVGADVYIEGDLAEYVKLNTDETSNGLPVVVSLNLPGDIEKPGRHLLFIGAKQKPGESGGIGIVGDVRGVIRVDVPYPGKYIESSLETNNANPGDLVRIKLTAENKGKETVDISPIVEIFYNSGDEKDSFKFKSRTITPASEEIFIYEINTSDYFAGNYNVSSIIEYGGERPSYAEGMIRIGELYIDILNTTNYFEKDKINRFEIDIESFWNDPIGGVYANVSVSENNVQFITPAISVNPWEKKVLTGFFDTTGFEKEKFNATVTINYEGKTTSKTFSLEFKKEGLGAVYIIVGISVLIIIVLIILVLIFVKRRRKNKSENGKKEK